MVSNRKLFLHINLAGCAGMCKSKLQESADFITFINKLSLPLGRFL